MTPSARWSSHELIPFRLLAIIHIAGSHLSKPSGESSKMVPSFTLNWATSGGGFCIATSGAKR